MTNQGGKGNGTILASTWAFVVLLAAGVVLGVFTPALVLKEFGTAEVLRLLGGYFAIALFVERTLEVFVSVARGPTAEKLTAAADTVRFTLAMAPADPAVRSKASLVNESLIDHRAETRKISLRAAVAIGALLAGAGLRTLGTFVEGPPGTHPELARITFKVFDVLITAGLIGGGSEAIHKLLSTLLAFLDAWRTRAGDTEPRLVRATPVLVPPLGPGPPPVTASSVPRVFYEMPLVQQGGKG